MVYQKNINTERRRHKKKSLIIETATELFLKKGFYNTSIRDIIGASGVSIGTFYNYFKSKEDIFCYLYEDFANMVFSINKKATTGYVENAAQYLSRSITTALMVYDRYRDRAIMLRVKEVGSNELFEKKVRKFTKRSVDGTKVLLENLEKSHSITIPDKDVFSICYVSTVNGMIINLLNEEKKQSICELAYPLIIYNLNALEIVYSKEEIERYIEELESDFETYI